MSEASGSVVAADLLARLAADGWTVATAESLTGGLVVAALVSVPGASAVVRGGVVAYATDVKASVLGVSPDLLARHGAVHPDVAAAMAAGARTALGADVGIATTGVAGPDPQDGHPPGTFHVAVCGPAGVVTESSAPDGVLPGDVGRDVVRRAAVDHALDLALRRLGDVTIPPG